MAADMRSADASSPFSPIPEVLDDLRAGKMVILTDDESRENEGDLVLPAQFVTPEAITFLLSVARGYLCLSLTEHDCDRLALHPQGGVNTSARGTAFTISIDGHPKHGFTTGVSARERARCIQMAADPKTKPDDFVRPGHINPLRARDGGVLVRTGQTEGSLDLCRLAGLVNSEGNPAAVIIEIMRDDGEMARLPDLVTLAKQHNLKICSVNQIIEHRLARESLVTRIAPMEGVPMRTAFGEFTMYAFRSLVDPLPHVALTCGGVGAYAAGTQSAIEQHEPTLVRVHRRDLLADVFAELPCDAHGGRGGGGGDTLRASMKLIQQEGRGAIVYLRHCGFGDPALTGELPMRERLQLLAPTAHASGSAVVGGGKEPVLAHSIARTGGEEPGGHDYGIGSQILRNLGLARLRLISGSSADYPLLESFGLSIVERVAP